MSTERLASVSISTAVRPAVGTARPGIGSGAGGSRIPNFSFKSFTPLESKPNISPVKTSKFSPDTFKPNSASILKAPKYSAKVIPVEGRRISGQKAFKNSAILWQAKPEALKSPVVKTDPVRPSREKVIRKTAGPRRITPEQVARKPVNPAPAGEPLTKPKITTVAEKQPKPHIEPIRHQVKEILRPKVLAARERSIKAEPLAKIIAEEISAKVQKPNPKRVEAILQNSRRVSLIALRQSTENLAKAVGLPKTTERFQVITTPTQTAAFMEPDLKQALKTYELLAAALTKTQIKQETAQKQATALVSRAMGKQALQEKFLILTGQKTEAQTTVKIMEQKHRIIEKKVVEIFFERDNTADYYREQNANAAANRILEQRSDQTEAVSGADIVGQMAGQPEPDQQISAILKPGMFKIDGSLKDFKSFIAQARIKSKTEAYKLISLAKRFFPAVRATTRVTTEMVTGEDIERVVQGETRHQYLESLLRKMGSANIYLPTAM